MKLAIFPAGRGPLAVFFCALASVLLCLAGCDKIKSYREARARRSSKERSARSSRNGATTSPKLAIILDDVGSDPAAVDQIFALHYPLTLSVLPLHPHSTAIAEEAHRRGYQVMLHLPMESIGNEVAESRELRVGMSSPQVSSDLGSMLGSVPYAAGVNNHQGSLATSNPPLMSELMPLLRQHRLFFIDSRTTAATVAFDAAERDGVPCAFRNVPFLDDVQEAGAIRRQLELAIRGAKEKGEAIAIGHPHPETLQVFREMLPQVQAQGVQLVHASALVH
ncbi:MAG TPA: divergent polysaccharide deacetylase family protein [Candidatus Acidoferrum sp.]